MRNAKIDMSEYDPNQNIEHNIKVLRGMISRAKKASNTNRAQAMV